MSYGKTEPDLRNGRITTKNRNRSTKTMKGTEKYASDEIDTTVKKNLRSPRTF